jgi:hypothetical protein
VAFQSRDTAEVVDGSLRKLRLEAAMRTHTLQDGKFLRSPESHYLDFVIDGASLSSLVQEGAPGLVTALNRPWLPGVPESVEVLLGRSQQPDLDPGRVPLLLCLMCGDLGCGMVTALLDVSETEVVWSSLRWEDGLQDPEPVAAADASFRFERNDYEAQFAGAYERVAAMPFDEIAHRGKRFLWPWQLGWRMPR